MTARRGRVSGHYAGVVTRAVALLLDWFILTTLLGILAGIVAAVVVFLTPWELPTTKKGVAWLLVLAGWGFLYFWVSLSVAGKTPGMALVGLKVVERDGSPLQPRAAFVRVLVMPLSFLLLGSGLLWALIDAERRTFHDIIAGTVVVYDWGDRPAEMPAPLTRWLQGRQADAFEGPPPPGP